MPDPPPARSTVGVAALPKGGLVEIEAIAAPTASRQATRWHADADDPRGARRAARPLPRRRRPSSRPAVAGVGDAELDARPIEGEWTVREIAHHLADGELNSAVRLRRLIAEDEPALPGYDEMEFTRRLHYGERAIAPSRRGRRRRPARRRCPILERLTEAEWARTGTHSEQGPYGVERLAARLRGPSVGPRRPGAARAGRACGAAPVDTPTDPPQNRRRLT